MMRATLRRLLVDQSGQTATEVLGLILVVAAILAVLAREEVGSGIREGIERQDCRVLGDDEDACGEKDRGDGPSARERAGDPQRSGDPSTGSVRLVTVQTGGATQGITQPVGPDPAENPACDEGYPPTDADGEDEVGEAILNGPAIRCADGVPILDLNRDGIDDRRQVELFCEQARVCQEDTDLNENGVPDRLEPGAFDYLTPPFKCGGGSGITDPFFTDRYCATANRYYRPGQPGVECEELDDESLTDSGHSDAIACKPVDGLLDDLKRFQARNDPQPGSICDATVPVAPEITCPVIGALGVGAGLLSRGDDAGSVVGLFRQLLRRSRGRHSDPVPQGFASADDFRRFGRELEQGLRGAGYRGVKPILQGSAVTGRAFKSGRRFDAGRVSDLDIALASPRLLRRARELGIGLRSGGRRTGPLTRRDAARLGLGSLQRELSKGRGRPVNFMIYRSADDATERAPSIRVPR